VKVMYSGSNKAELTECYDSSIWPFSSIRMHLFKYLVFNCGSYIL